MIFHFYITDLFDGKVKGTNEAAQAQQFAECEDFFVVDSQTGEWLTPFGREPISEA